MKRLLTVSAVVSAAGAAVYKRAQHLAETEQRPIGDVISSLPGRIASDMRTLPDDVRSAAQEGKQAYLERRRPDFDRFPKRP